MRRQPAVGFVLACVFLDALGIGLIIPVLPRLVGTLAESPDAQTAWYGAIMVSYGLMQFFSAPVIGALSDRIGRRPVLLAGICGLAIMMFVPAFTNSLWAILASRLAGGMMSSNMVVAQAYIADVTPAERRTSAFGRIGAIFGIAFILGPALGGLLGEESPRIPFLFAGIICTANFLYGLLILPESLPPNARSAAPISLSRINPLAMLASLSREKAILPILLIVTLYTLSQSIVQCTWALYTEFRYGWTPRLIGFSIFALGFAITATQGAALPWLAKRLSAERLTLAGLTVGFASLVGIGFSTNGTAAALLICTFALMGVVGPTLQSVVSRTGDPKSQGIRLGAMSSLNSFTGAISPVVGTPLLLSTIGSDPSSFSAGIPYLLSSLLIVAAAVIALLRPIPEK